jgi:pimeloyl-ACP methyl ester carboxylesterase
VRPTASPTPTATPAEAAPALHRWSCSRALIPQARAKIYPDAAHGFLFQYHAEFAADVDEFLTAGSS